MSIKLYSHQKKMADFWLKQKRSFNLSDAGVGKTLAAIDAFYRSEDKTKMLVFAPVSILKSAWADDIKKYKRNLTYEIINGVRAKKIERFNSTKADIIICSHDFSKFIIENNLPYHGKFSHIIIDECTAIKNHTAQRSKAIKAVTSEAEYLLLLSGTPINTTVEDLWYPTKLIDGGERLGKYLGDFRAEYRIMLANPKFTTYVDKKNSRQKIVDKIEDISIRFKMNDCVDLPTQSIRDITCELSKKSMQAYQRLKNDLGLFVKELSTKKEDVRLNALHAATKANKLLQVLTGAVYDELGNIIKVSSERYELIAELAKQRKHTVIVYNWSHQLPEIQKALDSENISNKYIAGKVLFKKRSEVIDKFQKGDFKVLIIHSQSCSHGITLTRASSIIWSSPTYSAERYQQVNARIHRISQEQKTEVLRIAAKDTKEIDVYRKLNNKVFNLNSLLEMLA